MVLLLLMVRFPDGTPPKTELRKNRLASESSPYLLQHQHNPVDWYPWGEEAFEKARKEDKPVFLSIGYSTCHWCHVMEKESFENEEIAALMNRDFVSIKVDREERPDLDNVYMTACQLTTQSGGWPLTVILTPEGNPFFAGTYFPPDDRSGRIGMRALLPRLAEIWKTRRAEVVEQANGLASAVQEALTTPPSGASAAALDGAFSDSLLEELRRRFDARTGGFSGAPKFPPHGPLQFLLARARAGRNPQVDAMLRKTLDEMQDGGIFDQVGGGFHRYSVDADWFVPHFEKMLYDNAQLLEIYAGAARVYGDPRYRETAERIVAWLEREMKTPEGAYASALDADSEGVEGKYYLWKATEIDTVLGAEAPSYRKEFDIRAEGNLPPQFEEGRGKNLPRRRESASPKAAGSFGPDQNRLEETRRRRPPPARDDKVVTSWNALAISGLANASRDLEDPRLLALSRRIANALLSIHLKNGLLLHVSRDGQAKIEGFLDDYALFARALLDLSAASGEKKYEARARELALAMVKRFGDEKGGGFYQTAGKGQRSLLESSKEFLDQVTPSPNAAAVEVLQRLNAAQPASAFDRAQRAALLAAAPYARSFPTAASSFAILVSGTASPAAAVPPASTRSGPAMISLVASDEVVRAGNRAELRVGIALDPGWHIQSHRPSREDLSATAVRPGPSQGLAFSEPRYPAGEEALVAGEKLSVYTGKTEIPIGFAISPEARAGETRVRVRVALQPCDDSRCLAPTEVEVSLPLKIRNP
jgi:uncharacterized protein YyaL (SSP411 family)